MKHFITCLVGMIMFFGAKTATGDDLKIATTIFLTHLEVNIDVLHMETGEEASDWMYDSNIRLTQDFRYSPWGVQFFLHSTAPELRHRWMLAYVGPTYAPAEWIELSVMAGAQSNMEYRGGVWDMTPDFVFEPRYATSLWVENNHFSTLTLVDFNHQGIDEVWYEIWGKYQTTKWLAVGTTSRRFTGTGPTVWFGNSEVFSRYTLWFSWTPVDFETGVDLTRGIGGFSLGNFGN